MTKEEHEKFTVWRTKMINTKDIAPIELGMSQENVISNFGTPDQQ